MGWRRCLRSRRPWAVRSCPLVCPCIPPLAAAGSGVIPSGGAAPGSPGASVPPVRPVVSPCPATASLEEPNGDESGADEPADGGPGSAVEVSASALAGTASPPVKIIGASEEMDPIRDVTIRARLARRTRRTRPGSDLGACAGLGALKTSPHSPVSPAALADGCACRMPAPRRRTAH
jgi:hypothetical protein